MQGPIILWKDQTSYFMKIISALWRFYLLGLNSRVKKGTPKYLLADVEQWLSLAQGLVRD